MARTKRSRIPDLGRPEVTELEFGRTTHRVAPVEPLDVDGVRTMTVGTIAWGVVAMALLPFWGTLQDQGRTWWLWTAIGGLGLGLMGIEYCKRRREAIQQAAVEPITDSVAGTAPAPDQARVKASDKQAVKHRLRRSSAPTKPSDPPEPIEPERPVGRRRRTT